MHGFGETRPLEALRGRGSWQLMHSSVCHVESPQNIRKLSGTLRQWREHFSKEETWVQNNLGVPSLIVRIDYMVDATGNARVFEIEERPGGIGTTLSHNADFHEGLMAVQRGWPQFVSVVSHNRRDHDDSFWIVSVVGLGTVQSLDSLVLVRAEPEEKIFHELQHRSVSVIRTKGNKSYGVPMGFWKPIADLQDLPWERPFVIKPLAGSKCQGVKFWLAQKHRQIKGCSTRSQILRQVELGAFIQEFMPMEFPGEPGYFTVLRMFFGYDLKTREYVPLGGCWDARKNLIVHGSSETIVGNLVV